MQKKVNERLKISVIGCGQGGCNIASAIEMEVNKLDGDKSNVAFVGINSSKEDLDSCSLSHKIHIEGSKGAAGNRNRSERELANSIEKIIEELESYIIKDSIVFVSTSLGGGTGGSIAPYIVEYLLDSGYAVGMIAILPSDNESIRIRDNARLAFDDVDELKPRMGNIFILDNNNYASNKYMINKIFAGLFTSVLCIDNRSTDGNYDLAELEETLMCPSFSIITKVGKDKANTADILEILNKPSNIFAAREDKTITILGISEATGIKDSQINMSDLRKEVGFAPTEYHGYGALNGDTIILMSGLSMPYSRINSIEDQLQKDAEIIRNSMQATQTVREKKSFDIFNQTIETKKTIEKKAPVMTKMDKLKSLKG